MREYIDKVIYQVNLGIQEIVNGLYELGVGSLSMLSVPCSLFLVPGIWSLASGFWYLTSDLCGKWYKEKNIIDITTNIRSSGSVAYHDVPRGRTRTGTGLGR